MFSCSMQYGSYNKCHVSTCRGTHRIVNPPFSTTAERSFSSLCRFMLTYVQLVHSSGYKHSIVICHVHKVVVDGIDVYELMKEFVLWKGRQLRSDIFSFKRTGVVWCNWFLQCFWLWFSNFEVSSCTPDVKKWVYKQFLLTSLAGCNPHF